MTIAGTRRTTAASHGPYGACGSKKARSGKAAEARIDPRETYLEKINTARKTTNAANAAHEASARKTPNAVATPLPPLNPSHTVYICPRIAQIAATAAALLDGTGARPGANTSWLATRTAR